MADIKLEKIIRDMVYPVRLSRKEYTSLMATAKKEHISIADVIRRSLFMKKGK